MNPTARNALRGQYSTEAWAAVLVEGVFADGVLVDSVLVDSAARGVYTPGIGAFRARPPEACTSALRRERAVLARAKPAVAGR